jgi:aminopeptidase N
MITVAGQDLPTENGTLIITIRNPQNGDLSAGILISSNMLAASSLAMRVPHYSKYSYLGFTGAEQVVKGTWEETRSPLSVELKRR